MNQAVYRHSSSKRGQPACAVSAQCEPRTRKQLVEGLHTGLLQKQLPWRWRAKALPWIRNPFGFSPESPKFLSQLGLNLVLRFPKSIQIYCSEIHIQQTKPRRKRKGRGRREMWLWRSMSGIPKPCYSNSGPWTRGTDIPFQWLEVQNHTLHQRPSESEPAFRQIYRCIISTLKFGSHFYKYLQYSFFIYLGEYT